MLYHHILKLSAAFLACSAPLEHGHQEINALQRAIEYRDFVRTEVRPGRGSITPSGEVRKTTDSAGSVAFDYDDGWIGVAKDNGQIFSFVLHGDDAMDPPWSELDDLANSELLSLCEKFYRAAGFSHRLKFVRCERRGSDGLPHGGQRFWRVSTSRLHGTVPTGRGTVIDFDLDADSHQLRAMAIDRGPIPPASLVPQRTMAEAILAAMAYFFAQDAGLELAVFGEGELCVWDPASYIKRDRPGTPSHVLAAIAAGRGLLAYEMAVSDVRFAPPGQGPTSYVAVDANTGAILFGGMLSSGLGGGKHPAISNRRWGAGPFSLAVAGAFEPVPKGTVTTVHLESKLSPGQAVILQSGNVVFQAEFHPKEGILSRNAAMGTIYAKPNQALLKALKLAAEQREIPINL